MLVREVVEKMKLLPRLAARAAALACLLAAAFVPRVPEVSRVWFRSRVAAAFFAASCLSAFVWAIFRSSFTRGEGGGYTAVSL